MSILFRRTTSQAGVMASLLRRIMSQSSSAIPQTGRFSVSAWLMPLSLSNRDCAESWGVPGLLYPALNRPSSLIDGIPGCVRGYATGANKGEHDDRTEEAEEAESEEMHVNTRVRDELNDSTGMKDKVKDTMHSFGEKLEGAGDQVKRVASSESEETEKGEGEGTGKGILNKLGDVVEGAGGTVKEKSSKDTSYGDAQVITQ